MTEIGGTLASSPLPLHSEVDQTVNAIRPKGNRFDRLWVKIGFASVIVLIGIGVAISIASKPNAMPKILSAINRLPHPPRLDYIQNGADPDEEVGYRYRPYCWTRQFYADNPRGYFLERLPEDFLLDGWHFDGMKETVLQVTPSDKTFPLNVAIETLKPDLPAWATNLHHTEVLYKAGSNASIILKASSKLPRAIDVLFWPVGDWNHPLQHTTINLEQSPKEFVIKLPKTESDIKLIPGFNLGGTPGNIVIDSIVLQGFSSTTAQTSEKHYIDYHMNKWGYRGQDWSTECPADVIRIACIGDSFTFGQGVKYQDLFSQVLDSQLNQTKHQKSQRFETMNFGMMGYSTKEEAAVLRNYAMAFSPKIVVLTMCSNDLISFKRDAEIHNLHKEPTEYQQAISNITKEEGFKFCIDQISEINSQCKEKGCKLVVGIFNVSEGFEWDQIVTEILPAMQKQGIPAFDIKQELLDAGCYSLNGVVHSTDFHPNEKAHAIYAKKLASILETQVIPNLAK